jgi:hypothetical protein
MSSLWDDVAEIAWILFEVADRLGWIQNSRISKLLSQNYATGKALSWS